MKSRLVAVTLSLALLSSCTIPRTAMVTGAATAIYGGVVLADSHVDPKGSFLNFAPLITGMIGGFLLLTGIGIFTSGTIGLAQEQAAHAEPATEPEVANAPVDGSTLPATTSPGSATAVLVARADQLALQLHVESRAGHCDAATAIARRLAVLDRARAVALIERDADIERCVSYRM